MSAKSNSGGIEVRVVSADAASATLEIKGCTCVQINALRRACMADVRVLAIDETHVYVNTTGVHDETIGHRLGFVPLQHLGNSRVVGMRPKTMCTCGAACPLCEVPLVIHFAARSTSVQAVDGTDATHAASSVLVAMTSKHIRRNQDAPVVPGCLAGTGHRILQALPGSQFTALCKARVGTAADGAKWSAVSNCAFRVAKPLDSSAKPLDGNAKPLDGNAKPLDGTGTGTLRKAAENGRGCASQDCAGKRISSVDAIPDESQTFLFTVETTGQMSPADVLHSALQSLRSRVNPAGNYRSSRARSRKAP